MPSAPPYAFAAWCVAITLVLLGAYFFSPGLVLLLAPMVLFGYRIHTKRWDRNDTDICLAGLMVLSLLTLLLISVNRPVPQQKPLLTIQTSKGKRIW